MLFSIVVYILFGATLYMLASCDVKYSYSYKVTNCRNRLTIWSLIYITIFSLVSGLRYNLGADCESYVTYFISQHFNDNVERGEYLFHSINSFLYSIGMRRVLFLTFWAFVEIFLFYAALKTRKYLLPFISVVLILGPHYYGWMNGIRQMVATCIFVYAIQQKIDNNRFVLFSIIYTILIYVASLFHHSALLLLIFLIIPNLDYFDNKYINRYIVITTVLVSAFLGQQGWVKEPLNQLAIVLGGFNTGYESYLERIGVYTEELTEGMGYGPRRLVILFVSLLIIWYYPKMKKYYNDKFLVFSYTVFVLFAIFSENLLSSVHSSMSRPFMYFKPFKLICNAYLLYYLYHQYKNKPLLFYLVLILSVCYMILDNYVVAGNPSEATLFKFIFTHS